VLPISRCVRSGLCALRLLALSTLAAPSLSYGSLLLKLSITAARLVTYGHPVHRCGSRLSRHGMHFKRSTAVTGMRRHTRQGVDSHAIAQKKGATRWGSRCGGRSGRRLTASGPRMLGRRARLEPSEATLRSVGSSRGSPAAGLGSRRAHFASGRTGTSSS
jgi:hypothetical protein